MIYPQNTISPKLHKLLDELKINLVNLYGQQLYSLILFGSQARGEATPDSDIDIMTVLEDPIDVAKEIHKTSEIKFYFIDKYEELISIIPVSRSEFTSSSISLIRIAKREGIKL
jgi:predicted nucleotidyltransferase